MTGLCIILIDAAVARQETQKKGHLVVTSRRVPQNIKDTEESFVVQKTSVLFFQYVDIAISYYYYYCKPLLSKPVFLLPRAANEFAVTI